MYFSKQDLSFNLHELLNVGSLTQYPYFQDHSSESFEMVLDAAEQISDKMLRPLLTVMDREEPQLVEGKIKVNEGMKAIMKRFGDDGWINAPFSYEEGGQQLPSVVHNAAAFIFQSANYSASVFPFLSTGASNLIRNFGSETLKKIYLPKMFDGTWQGTMALTEPQAGSSLSDISTSAEPTENEGVYKIKGQKIFISCGDHDACENIIHLMLAKIKGGPLGTKGISLFVVPQKRFNHSMIQSLNDSMTTNDVQTAGVYHKMGYKGAPIAHLMMGSNDDCFGYLVGEPHKGLNYMFQMMNEARVGVGMNAAAIGTAAYYASLQYARERPQGRLISEKDPAKSQTFIINHADVKRMLLFQKSVVEGSLSLLLYCGMLSDLIHVSEGEEKQNFETLLDMLTPIAKSYPSEMCCLTTSAAIQILGGSGYTNDFPVEQYYREARIHPIHEGTTAIHGLDLLGRKVTMKGGTAVVLLVQEISKTIDEAKGVPKVLSLATKLAESIESMGKVLRHKLSIATQNQEVFLADATLFLEMVGINVIAWQWLKQAIAAQKGLEENKGSTDFYSGKLATANYFFEYELVKTESLAKRLMSEENVTVEMQNEWF